jgi:hypothetical protein
MWTQSRAILRTSRQGDVRSRSEQFRLLFRHSLGRLMDAALASRDTDATQFALWATALVATLPFFWTAKMMGVYSFLWRRPDVLQQVAISHRIFFVVYAMLAAALLAAALWDALVPDRQDQEILGVLAVDARTVTAARLAAALAVATGFLVAVAIPCALMYTLNVATGFKSAPIVGWWLPTLAGHLAAMFGAGLFTFAALLTIRGLAVLCVGADAAQRAAVVLQLVTTILLVEVFIFLPTVVPGLIRALADRSSALGIPPLWFVGLFAWFAGPPAARVPGLAPLGVLAPALALTLAAVVYLLPARLNARRALEKRTSDRGSRVAGVIAAASRPVLRAPATRAIFAFTVASLARSRRHALIIATYAGLGVAVAGVRLIVATARDRPLGLDAPADHLLALPLVLTFFLVFGLRAAFAVPTDVDANWTFRLAQPSPPRVFHAVAAVLMVAAVMPVTLAWALITATLWAPSVAGAAAIMHLASGWALVELAVVDCCAVPFTRAHAASPNTVKISWAWFLLALHVYAFRLDDAQVAAIGSSLGTAIYVGAMIAVAAGARAYRRVRRQPWPLRFDAPIEAAAETLNLSRATG